MLKGLALTPPVIGRIAIGRVVEKAGRRLPEKDDEFTLTSQVQNRDGWLLHPLDETLRQQSGGKLRSLPVRLLFNDPSLNLRADYNLFDRSTGRPVCVGNGESCRRSGQDGIESLPCPGSDTCRFAEGQCKPYARFNVRIGEEDETDPRPTQKRWRVDVARALEAIAEMVARDSSAPARPSGHRSVFLLFAASARPDVLPHFVQSLRRKAQCTSNRGTSPVPRSSPPTSPPRPCSAASQSTSSKRRSSSSAA